MVYCCVLYFQWDLCALIMFLFGCQPVTQSSNARPNISRLKKAFVLTGGTPVSLAVIFIFKINIYQYIHRSLEEGIGSRLTPTALLCDGYMHGFGCPTLGPHTCNVNR